MTVRLNYLALPGEVDSCLLQRRAGRRSRRAAPILRSPGFLTRPVFFWYFDPVMRVAVPAFERFTREGRARPVYAATLLLR
jgi:hypothetical protein